MTTVKRWLLVVAALGAVAVGAAYAASAGSNDPTGPSPKLVAASAAGMPPTAQVWYAVVNADASLARGFPQNAAGTWITTIHITTGEYQVTFKQDLTACSYDAVIGNAGDGNPTHGTIVTALRVSNSKAVYVETRNLDGNLADHPFHLRVTC